MTTPKFQSLLSTFSFLTSSLLAAGAVVVSLVDSAVTVGVVLASGG